MGNKHICNFCDKEATKDNPVCATPKVGICKECTELAYNIFNDPKSTIIHIDLSDIIMKEDNGNNTKLIGQ